MRTMQGLHRWLALIATGCGAAELSSPKSSTANATAEDDAADSAPAIPGSMTTTAATSAGHGVSSEAGDASTGGGQAERDWREQVIYLVMTDRFVNGDTDNDDLGPAGCYDPEEPRKYHGGDLEGLRSRLDYLVELGITTLWITPVYLQSPDRCGYHGYWADFAVPDDGEVSPTLGSLEELQGLADDLHARGMRLVLDMIVNHAGPGARVVATNPEWFHDPAACGRLGPEEVYCPIGGSPLPDFAQEKPEVADYLDALTVGWIERVPIDGIRMDTVKHVPEAYWSQRWIPAVKAANPQLFVVGEVFETQSTDKLVPYLDAGFDSLFNFPLMAEIVHVLGGDGSVDPLAARVSDQIQTLGQERMRALTGFVDNHDLPRFAGHSGGDAGAKPRVLLALGALFTLPGIPMLYYGDELGLLGGGDPDNRRDMPAWAFSVDGRAAPHPDEALIGSDEIFARVQRLIALRQSHPALVHGDIVELWRKGARGENIYAFVRLDPADPIVVVLNNDQAEVGPLAIPVANNGGLSPSDVALFGDGAELVELLGAGAPTSLAISDGKMTISLPGKTMGIYALSR